MKSNSILLILLSFNLACQQPEGAYVCTPCNLPCDELSFTSPGKCPHCNMKLVKKSNLEADLSLAVNQINIRLGSGYFKIEGGDEKDNTITIHYYKPNNFTTDSKVIIVLPGAGRNGDDYRDAWIEASEKYGVLVLSPEYPEDHYPGLWSYNLAGMHNVVTKDDFTINENPSQWIYGDFDRIFTMVQTELQLTQSKYDLFGHSAGGQIIHRLAIFYPKNKIDRMLTSNSGWYTVPTNGEVFPFGLDGITLDESEIDYTANLTVFLGEKDDANETRGHLRHGPEADRQGLDRISRGQYFYEISKLLAIKHGKKFNWMIEIIPDIGHDSNGMSRHAADYLYENQTNYN